MLKNIWTFKNRENIAEWRWWNSTILAMQTGGRKAKIKYCNLKVNHGFKKIEAIRDKISDQRGDVDNLKMKLGRKEYLTR